HGGEAPGRLLLFDMVREKLAYPAEHQGDRPGQEASDDDARKDQPDPSQTERWDGHRPGFQEESKTEHLSEAYAVGEAPRRKRPNGGGEPEDDPELRADLDALAHPARHEVDEEDHVW